jgi:hypothetical protein
MIRRFLKHKHKFISILMFFATLWSTGVIYELPWNSFVFATWSTWVIFYIGSLYYVFRSFNINMDTQFK